MRTAHRSHSSHNREGHVVVLEGRGLSDLRQSSGPTLIGQELMAQQQTVEIDNRGIEPGLLFDIEVVFDLIIYLVPKKS